MNENLAAVLRSRYEGALNRTFLREPGGSPLSYGSVDDLAARMGSVLVSAGASRGERVLVQVQKSPLAVALYLACLRIGAVHVPLNPSYTPAELEHFVADCAPAVMVCDSSRIEVFRRTGSASGVASVMTLDGRGEDSVASLAESLEGVDPVVVAGDEPAVMLYTSGTTGRPKGAVLTHTNLVSNSMALHEAWGFRTGDVVLHSLPIFHAHGLFVALHTSMLNASEVIFLPRFDADTVIAHLHEATVVMGVPTYYSRLLESPRLDAGVCGGVRLFTSGSAPLPPAVFEAFERRTGHQILERYGTTETGMITSNPLYGERVAGSVGFPLPGVTVEVVDERGAAVAPGEVGRVSVGGPGVFPGYWPGGEAGAGDGAAGGVGGGADGLRQRVGGAARKRADDAPATADSSSLNLRRDGFLPSGSFVTGDLGRVDPEGRLTLVGRSSDLVITAGLNVYPVEVEQRIEEVKGVAECAVVGVPHPDLGESVVAAVVPTSGAAGDFGALQRDLKDHVETSLARFKRPRSIFFVDELPRNAMGKLEKSVLRERYGGTFVGGSGRGGAGSHGESAASG